MDPKLVIRSVFGFIVVVVTIVGLTVAVGNRAAVVKGHVSLGGRPVIWGSVVLVGADGQSVAGRIQPDGTFTVPNAPVGEVTVTITSPDPLVQHYATQLKSSRDRIPVNEWGAPPVDRRQWFVIPKRYENAYESNLKFTVKRGSNEYNLDLAP
jgi:hypothetical protein